MKKNFLTFFFALITSSIFALPENERCITFTESSPFKVTAKGDGILVGACVATTATALALPYILDLPDYDERTYDMNSINDLDRKFARKYNRTIHNAGTVTVAGCYLITPALYLAEYSLGNFDFHEGLMVAVMFAETVGIGNSVKNFLKVAFHTCTSMVFRKTNYQTTILSFLFQAAIHLMPLPQLLLQATHSADIFRNQTIEYL